MSTASHLSASPLPVQASAKSLSGTSELCSSPQTCIKRVTASPCCRSKFVATLLRGGCVVWGYPARPLALMSLSPSRVPCPPMSNCAQPILTESLCPASTAQPAKPSAVPTTQPLDLSSWSDSDRQGLLRACVFRWGTEWSASKIESSFNVAVGLKVQMFLDGGYTATVCTENPQPASLTSQRRVASSSGFGVAVGVGRPCIHALWLETNMPGELAHERPYLAEVVALLVPKVNPRRMYCLAQFHEVSRPPGFNLKFSLVIMIRR